MTTIVQDSYSHAQFAPFFAPLGRLYAAFIARRQRQADRRLALYFRSVPDDVLLRLGVSVDEIRGLRGEIAAR